MHNLSKAHHLPKSFDAILLHGFAMTDCTKKNRYIYLLLTDIILRFSALFSFQGSLIEIYSEKNEIFSSTELRNLLNKIARNVHLLYQNLLHFSSFESD